MFFMCLILLYYSLLLYYYSLLSIYLSMCHFLEFMKVLKIASITRYLDTLFRAVRRSNEQLYFHKF